MRFDDTKPKVGRGDSVKLEELIDILKFNDGKWTPIRMFDTAVLPCKRHWVNIIGAKSKKEVKIPKWCVSHDTKTDGELEDVSCPYCGAGIGAENFYLVNVIARDLQEDEPAKKKSPTKKEAKSGFKQPGSETWTPVRVARLPSSLAQKIQGLKDLNKVKKDGKVTKYSVADPKFGCDISIKYDSKASGTDKYQVQMGERNKLTSEEKEYLQYELHDGLLTEAGREDQKTAEKELGRMELVGAEDTDDDDDQDDDDEGLSLGKKKKKGKGKPDKKAGKKSKKSDDDDDDDQDDDDDEDEDEDDSPKSKKSKKSKGKPAKGKGKSKKSDDDDDDDDDDAEDDEDEDEDDEPKSKKSKKAPAKSKKSKKSDDDDDDDEDEDDEDDEDEDDDDSDEDDDDDSDDDDDDDDDEEDDEPKSKKSKGKASKKPVKGKAGKKSKKSDDDDEDDDDDAEDDDDDEDDEPKSKKSKKSKGGKADKKAGKKSKGKKSKKSDDDDDDDDDIPF